MPALARMQTRPRHLYKGLLLRVESSIARMDSQRAEGSSYLSRIWLVLAMGLEFTQLVEALRHVVLVSHNKTPGFRNDCHFLGALLA